MAPSRPALPTLPHELYRLPLPTHSCDLVLRMVQPATDTAPLVRVINWAYRGKPNVVQWTGESHLIKSPRITAEGLTELLQSVERAPNDTVFVVAVKQFYSTAPAATHDGNGIEHIVLQDNTQLVGCCKIERLVPQQHLTHDGRDEYRQQLGATRTVCELGMLSVDPSQTQQHIGRTLMDYAQYYALQHMRCTQMYLWVVSIRPELLKMYAKLGFNDTGDRNSFDIPGIVWHDGVDKSTMFFAVLKKELTADDATLSKFGSLSARAVSPPPAAAAPVGTEQLDLANGNGTAGRSLNGAANGTHSAPTPDAAERLVSKAGKQQNQAVLSVSIDSIPTDVVITKYSNLYHVIVTQSPRGIVGTWIHAQCDQASALVDMNTVSYELQTLLGDKNNATIHLIARRLIQIITEQHVLSLEEQQLLGSDIPSLLLTCALQRRKAHSPDVGSDYADADMALAKTIVHVIEQAGVIKQHLIRQVIDE